MQPGEDQLDAGNAFFGVNVDWHAAAVVGHLATAIGVQRHLDAGGVAGQCLVDGVINHLLRQMVGPGGVGVHARAAFDRVETGQDFDIGSVVARIHSDSGSAERVEKTDKARSMGNACPAIKPQPVPQGSAPKTAGRHRSKPAAR